MRVRSIQGSGWFPFCIDPNDEPLYSLQGDLDTLMKWFWRVKSFQWAADCTIAGNFQSFSGTFERSSTEEELQCVQSVPIVMTDSLGLDTFSVTFSPFAGAPKVVTVSEGVYKASHGITGTIVVNGTAASVQAIGGGQTLVFDGVGVEFFAGPDAVVDIEIAPLEYYEYRDANGENQIWDSATGGQLLDPFANQDPLG